MKCKECKAELGDNQMCNICGCYNKPERTSDLYQYAADKIDPLGATPKVEEVNRELNWGLFLIIMIFLIVIILW